MPCGLPGPAGHGATPPPGQLPLLAQEDRGSRECGVIALPVCQAGLGGRGGEACWLFQGDLVACLPPGAGAEGQGLGHQYRAPCAPSCPLAFQKQAEGPRPGLREAWPPSWAGGTVSRVAAWRRPCWLQCVQRAGRWGPGARTAVGACWPSEPHLLVAGLPSVLEAPRACAHQVPAAGACSGLYRGWARGCPPEGGRDALRALAPGARHCPSGGRREVVLGGRVSGPHPLSCPLHMAGILRADAGPSRLPVS